MAGTKVLYYDCFAGISGDMNLGAMIDLGVDKNYLIKGLDKLSLSGYRISVSKESKNGISGTRVSVNLGKNSIKHSGSGHSDNSGDGIGNRNLEDIITIINSSKLSGSIKKNSIQIFRRIAEAEAKVHNKPVSRIHFHEVGATDSIIDIVGAAICLDYLKPDIIMASSVELGGGFVECAHGILPVPAPATVEILKGIPVRSGAVMHETTTPTGAAILASIVSEFTDKTDFTIDKIGYGLGYKDFDIPNLLRVYLGEFNKAADTDSNISLIVECNIDDMNPELYDYIFDSLFSAGANDVFITPIIMKKSRPAVTLSVLCSNEIEYEIEKILLKETSTLGVRKYKVTKTMLNRKVTSIDTPFGKVRIKSAFYGGRPLKSKPEYEDCLRIAKENQMSISEVYNMVSELLLKGKPGK
ncbi:MAG: nickel pincer cofactor biosynthesis protein LarC [Bacteroidales bacterium]|nr:nickel pincer cofactor biosynthesis protein LarC [Bacteroidales bacterium]